MSAPLISKDFIQMTIYNPPFEIELREDYLDLVSPAVPDQTSNIPSSAGGFQQFEENVSEINSTYFKSSLFNEKLLRELCRQGKPLEAIHVFLQCDYTFFTRSNAVKCFEALNSSGYKQESLNFAKEMLQVFHLFPVDARFFFSDCFAHLVNENINDGLHFATMLLSYLSEELILTVVKDCYEILDKKDPVSAINFIHCWIGRMDQSKDPLNARLLAAAIYQRLEKQERNAEAELFIQKCRMYITTKEVLASLDSFMNHRNEIQKNMGIVIAAKRQHSIRPNNSSELNCRIEKERNDYKNHCSTYQSSIQSRIPLS